jgi:hypothetical protein
VGRAPGESSRYGQKTALISLLHLPEQQFPHLFVVIFVPEFELRASHWLSKCTTSVLFALVILEIGSHFFLLL